MADLLVRNIDPKVKNTLKKRAHAHGRSLSEEVKAILDKDLKGPEPPEKMGMGTWMQSLLPPEFRGDDLVFEYKGEFPKPPDFD
jgi:plasmid stability protein